MLLRSKFSKTTLILSSLALAACGGIDHREDVDKRTPSKSPTKSPLDTRDEGGNSGNPGNPGKTGGTENNGNTGDSGSTSDNGNAGNGGNTGGNGNGSGTQITNGPEGILGVWRSDICLYDEQADPEYSTYLETEYVNSDGQDKVRLYAHRFFSDNCGMFYDDTLDKYVWSPVDTADYTIVIEAKVTYGGEVTQPAGFVAADYEFEKISMVPYVGSAKSYLTKKCNLDLSKVNENYNKSRMDRAWSEIELKSYDSVFSKARSLYADGAGAELTGVSCAAAGGADPINWPEAGRKALDILKVEGNSLKAGIVLPENGFDFGDKRPEEENGLKMNRVN